MTDASGDVPGTWSGWASRLFLLAVVAAVPAVLSLVTLAAKTPGLVLGPALEAAQVARHVASGDGMVTDSIRPLSLAVRPVLERHPDLYQAPVHPLFLGLVFRLFHASDRVDVCAGLGLWTASIVLTFWLARRRFGTGTAILAAAFYGSNVAMLKGAAFGLWYPLGALGVLAASALARSGPEPLAEVAEDGADRLLFGSGLLAGLLFLTHYALLFLAPAIALYQIFSRRRRARAAGLFAVGFLTVALPWMIRNVVWARSPFFSLYGYEALAGTDSFPGDAVWRTMTAARTGPIEFGFLHPLEMARKILTGLVRVIQEGPSITDPVVGALAAAAVLGGAGGAWRGWLRVLAAGAVLTTVGSCYFRPEPELLLAWTPLLAIAAAVQATRWLEEAVGAIGLRPVWGPWAAKLFRTPDRLRLALGVAGRLGLAGLVAISLLHYLFVYRAEGRSTDWEAEPLQRLLPADTVVLTDQPSAVAWAGRRRAVWLCLEESDWVQIEAAGRRIDATYVSPSVVSNPTAARAAWWAWIASPRGIYRDLVPVDATPLPGAFRRRPGVKG